jgi:hypothetical protein
MADSSVKTEFVKRQTNYKLLQVAIKLTSHKTFLSLKQRMFPVCLEFFFVLQEKH